MHTYEDECLSETHDPEEVYTAEDLAEDIVGIIKAVDLTTDGYLDPAHWSLRQRILLHLRQCELIR